MTKVIGRAISAALFIALCAQPALAQKSYSASKDLSRKSLVSAPELFVGATNESACLSRGYSFDFFNGVNTTPLDAGVAVKTLERIYGTTAPNGEPITYQPFYNQTLKFNDFLETFSQRLNEQDQALQNRYELFWEALRGGGSISTRVVSVVSSYDNLLSSFAEYLQAAIPGAIGELRESSPTISDYQGHRNLLDTQVLEGQKIIIFAHSQGNLFANRAYSHVAPRVGAPSVALIHVAPASPLTNGPWTLANLDLVINGLRLVGSVPDVTTPIPGYLLRPAGLNGRKDFLGHGLLEIYLNPGVSTRSRVDEQVNNALSSLASPQQEAQIGFFNATLTWNGSGDVDLHTYEPQGGHVYYAASRGAAGYLDVDNVVSDGPEHYYASCDPNILQTGTYSFAVNNFARADGRTATIQIVSRGVVLAQRQIVLGSAQGSAGNSSPSRLVTATVSRDSQTGVYSVSTR